MLSIFYGLASAFTWGAADYCGGLASRKARPYQAVLLGETAGLVILLVGVSLSSEAPIHWSAWLMCTIAGSTGVLGLLLFFQSMAAGKMSIAAPVSALTAAILPVIVGSILEGFPGLLTMAGFVLALAAIWFISHPDGGPRSLRLRLADLKLPILAGVGFGIYYILLHSGSQDGFFWPMISSRLAGVVTMVVYTLARRQPFLPAAPVWLLVILNGILDVTGNGFYILAGQAGRMDVAAVLASLYPASTVLLAGLFLHERLNRLQLVGIIAALAAIVLMTV